MKLEAAKQDGSNGAIAFDLMRTAFERTWKSHPNRRWDSLCRFAGRPARIRVAGQGLSEQIARAFEHLLVKENSSSPELKIDLWDEGDTSVFCPVNTEPLDPCLLKSTSYVEFGLILGSLNDPYIGCHRPQVVTWFDRREQHIVGWISHHHQLPIYERGKPLHFPLLLWHSDRGGDAADGHTFALYIIAVAAAEVGVGLAMVLLIFRNRRSISLDELSEMKG